MTVLLDVRGARLAAGQTVAFCPRHEHVHVGAPHHERTRDNPEEVGLHLPPGD